MFAGSQEGEIMSSHFSWKERYDQVCGRLASVLLTMHGSELQNEVQKIYNEMEYELSEDGD